jgi:hypothetical protein
MHVLLGRFSLRILGQQMRGGHDSIDHEGNTEEENNGYIVLNEISTDRLEFWW